REFNQVTDLDADLLGEILSKEDAGAFIVVSALGAFECEQLALLHRPFDIRDTSFENGINAFEGDEGRFTPTRNDSLAEYGWAGSGHTTELAQPLNFGVIVVDPADLPHVYMCRGPEDSVAKLPLKSGHQGKRHNQG